MNVERTHRFFGFRSPTSFKQCEALLFPSVLGFASWPPLVSGSVFRVCTFAFPIGFRVCTLAPLGPDDNVLLGAPKVLIHPPPKVNYLTSYPVNRTAICYSLRTSCAQLCFLFVFLSVSPHTFSLSFAFSLSFCASSTGRPPPKMKDLGIRRLKTRFVSDFFFAIQRRENVKK